MVWAQLAYTQKRLLDSARFSPNTVIYHATDVIFSDRMRHLDIGDWASFEFTAGASFQPYQGFRLHAGFDYEWLTPDKVHLYAGTQYALGLKDNTLSIDSRSSVGVGYHSYLVPFAGIMYWPGKRDIQAKPLTPQRPKPSGEMSPAACT